MNDIYTNAFPYILSTTVLIGGYFVYKYWPTIKRILAVLAIAITVLTGGYLYARGPEIQTIQKIVEVPRAKEDLNDLLSEVPKAYGVPEVIARAIVKQESGGNMEAIRFEPGQMSRAAKFTKNVEQQRMYASSHCAMQVMGYHSVALGIKWSDLYDPRTCTEAGMKILSDCLHRGKESNKYDKYFNALACYNGSEKYAREVMGAVARDLINEAL